MNALYDILPLSNPLCIQNLDFRIKSRFMPPKSRHPVETFVALSHGEIMVVLDEMRRGHYKYTNNLSRGKNCTKIPQTRQDHNFQARGQWGCHGGNE